MMNAKYKSTNKGFNKVTINETRIFYNYDFEINIGNFIA